LNKTPLRINGGEGVGTDLTETSHPKKEKPKSRRHGDAEDKGIVVPEISLERDPEGGKRGIVAERIRERGDPLRE